MRLQCLLLKIRYPQELRIEDTHVAKALSDMQIIYNFVKTELEKLETK